MSRSLYVTDLFFFHSFFETSFASLSEKETFSSFFLTFAFSYSSLTHFCKDYCKKSMREKDHKPRWWVAKKWGRRRIPESCTFQQGGGRGASTMIMAVGGLTLCIYVGYIVQHSAVHALLGPLLLLCDVEHVLRLAIFTKSVLGPCSFDE